MQRSMNPLTCAMSFLASPALNVVKTFIANSFSIPEKQGNFISFSACSMWDTLVLHSAESMTLSFFRYAPTLVDPFLRNI